MRATCVLTIRIGFIVAARGVLTAPAGAEEYKMEKSVVDTGSTYYYDLDADGQGNAHAFYEEGGVDRLYYNNNVGGQWGTPQFIGTTSNIGSTAVAGAVDSAGVSHIAYDSGQGGNDVFNYATNPGGSWSTKVVRPTSRWYSLDLTTAGVPQVAYYYDYSGLNYAIKSGTTWTHEVVDSTGQITAYAGRYPDLVLDAGDHAHIVYYNYTTDAIRYASNSSGGWKWEDMVTGAGSQYAEITLSPEPEAMPTAVYVGSGQVWLTRREANVWKPKAVTAVGNFRYLDVKTDAGGRAYVVYNDQGGSKLMLAVEAGNAFEHYEILETQAGGSGPVLQIHDGRVHVLAWDQTTKELLHLVGPLPVKGDLNCDAKIDFDDIDPFVLALSGQQAYLAQYPNCRWLNADCNADGTVDFDDIDPFVALLTGG